MVYFHFTNNEFSCSCKCNNTWYINRSRAKPIFVRSIFHLLDPTYIWMYVTHTCSLWSIYFMTRHGQTVNKICLNINGNISKGLYAIGMENNICFMENLTNRSNILDDSNFSITMVNRG